MSSPGDITSRGGAAARLDRLPPTRWLKGVLLLTFLSWFVESYDIGLTGSVLPTWTHLYHLSSPMKSLASIAANIGIVIGIVPAGWLSDRYGRRPILIIGTIAYSVLTFATGLAGSITEIITLRMVAGLAMGAVFPLPYVIASELCRPNLRGKATGFADSLLSVGYFLSPLLALVLIPNVENTTGWRVMFFLGAAPVLFALLTWRYLPESPRWSESKGRLEASERTLTEMEARAERATGSPLPPLEDDRRPAAASVQQPFKAIFSSAQIRRSVTLWVTFGGVFFLFYSIQTFMPTIINHLGFTLTSSFAFTSIIVGASIPGKLFESWAVERWGRRPVIMSFTLVAAIGALCFGFMRGATLVVAVGCVMSFFGVGVDPAVKVYTSENYPTSLRASGASTTECFGRLLSGVIGPACIPPLLAAAGVGAVYVLVGIVALVAVVTVGITGGETRGKTLEQVTGRESPVQVAL